MVYSHNGTLHSCENMNYNYTQQYGWISEGQFEWEKIKENIVPTLTEKQKLYVYANEADILNVSLFGMTAKKWRESNSSKEGNIRDYANTIELAILSNLEFYNSKVIEENIPQQTRLILLNNEANKEKELFNKNNEKVLKITNNE